MNAAIFKIVASFVGWLAARSLDRLVSRWLAAFIIAWENKASDIARAEFAAAIAELKSNMPDKYDTWQKWRERVEKSV